MDFPEQKENLNNFFMPTVIGNRNWVTVTLLCLQKIEMKETEKKILNCHQYGTLNYKHIDIPTLKTQKQLRETKQERAA